jgi:hypothetical protein
MTPEEIESELKYRIHKDTTHFKGELPESYAIAWRAYLAGLLEWDVIDITTYDILIELLPSVNDDPSVMILQGRDYD